MTAADNELLQAVLALPEADRWQFVDALLATLPPESEAPLDEAWLKEIRHRSAEYDAGRMTASPWEEVRERVRQRHESHG